MVHSGGVSEVHVEPPNAGDTLDEVAPGLLVPHRITATVTGIPPYDLELVIEFVDGRFACTSLTARRSEDGESITGDGIRKIPVAAYVSAAVREAARRVDTRSRDEVLSVPVSQDARSYSKRGPVDDTLREVAAVYRLAYVLGEAPLKSVVSAFDVPRSTASRWVAAARDKEFLGASEGRGKAGA